MDKEFGHSSIHSVESKSTSDPISTKDVPVVEVRVDVVSEKDGGNVESGLSNIAPQEIDGGAKAWLQVFGAWFLFLNSWGLTNSFGVFQTYYSTVLLTESSVSSIAWIGSIQTFLTMFMGVFAGWLMDTGRVRISMLGGMAFSVFGMLMTSLGSNYWHFLLSQGICVGLGSGLLAVTSLALLPLYFTKRRMLAGGIVATGSGLAGVVYPIMMRSLFDRIGFGWAVRVLALIILITLAISLVVIKPRKSNRKSGPLFRLRYFKEPIYMSFVFGFTFMVAAVYVPYFFIEDYALAISIDKEMTFYVLSIMNAATFCARFLPNWLADRYGGINILIPCSAALIAVFFSWPQVRDLKGLIIEAVSYAIAAGGMVSIPPLVIANLTPDPSEYGTRIGMGYTIAAIGALVGNPIAGAARRSAPTAQEEFQGTWYFAAAGMVVATLLMLWTRVGTKGWALNAKI